MGPDRLIRTVGNIETAVAGSASATRVLVILGGAISTTSAVNGWYIDAAIGTMIASAGIVYEIRRRYKHRT